MKAKPKLDLSQVKFKTEQYPDGGHADHKREDFVLTAMYRGKEIGYVVIIHYGNSIAAYEASVDKPYQRQGLGTMLYDEAERLSGKEAIPYAHAEDEMDFEEDLTEHAQNFWHKRWKTKLQSRYYIVSFKD